MKPSLVILSDLWGKNQSDWWNSYTELLKDRFVLTFLDSGELAEISSTVIAEEKRHQQFVNGGIDRAVQQLIELVKVQPNSVYLMGFSIGGTIAWKAALQGLAVTELIVVSATRLRYECESPTCPIQLYFGEDDPYLPWLSWLEEMKLNATLISNQGHEFYRDYSYAKQLCKVIP